MSIKDAVTQLYCFRDEYFMHHSTNNAEKKNDDLALELQKTLKIIDGHTDENDKKLKNEHDLLKAKALNVLPDFNQEAMDILTKIVKFHPKNTDAWNELGISFWKKNDLKAAKSCFENVLKEEKNAGAFQSLSMILRQMGGTPEEKLQNVHESLKKAREAVNLDIQNGKSWYILGNAYLSLYFITDQDPILLKQSLSAYNQAFSDKSVHCNSDLYFNWATALKYDENYLMVLENLEKALKYDPLWTEAKEQLESVTKYLNDVQLLTSKKGKLKPRRLKEILDALQKENKSHPSEHKFIDERGKSVVLKEAKLSDLQVGNNSDRILKGKVVCHVYRTDCPAFTFCMIDGEICFAVNVLNLAKKKGPIIGDSVAIQKPFLQTFEFTFKDKEYSFSSIKVNNPLHLEINGKPLQRNVLAPATVTVTLKPD